MTPPSGLENTREWWLGIKFARGQVSSPIPGFTDAEGRPWTVVTLPEVNEYLHFIDKHSSGQIQISEVVTTPGSKRRYIVDSLIEEAITSSQLEGASTTKRVAKEMIRSGRAPVNKSERMILNNFQAMSFVSENYSEPLTVDRIKQIHRMVTDGTLDNSDAAGRFQEPGEDRVVIQNERGELLHIPPPAELLEERMELLCDFANSTGGDTPWMHPVTRAVVLHFWLGYDHPFEDGNGRTARAIFYWSMLHQGYWLTEYLSISSILKRGPAKYARAFLYSELDDNDFTYFLLFQLNVVKRAIESMRSWLQRKMEEVRTVEQSLKGTDLNYRQVALVGHALRNPGASYTYKGHAVSHDVSVASARNDLLDLQGRGLLSKHKRGRQHEFRPVQDLSSQLRDD